MSELALRVENLSKLYAIGPREKYRALRDLVTDALYAPFRRLGHNPRSDALSPVTRHPSPDTIWALKDVSFEVREGEVLGIIGRNGAGKTTLLKILSRITEPTDGSAELFGRVGSLLEVGTGFHPELTGRENIYLNGAILGMKRTELNARFDEIVAFAEVEMFLDTPVKHYSSGMYVRLAFAVAAHLEPEILLVDEVLAVGDAGFQKKCLGKMGDVAKEGRTVLFVSHQMDMIRSLCERCVLLSQGQIRSHGDPGKVIGEYINSLGSQNQSSASFEIEEDESLALQITRGRVVDENGQVRDRFDVFERIAFDFEYVVRKPMQGLIVNLELSRNGATLFLSFDSDTDPNMLEMRQPGTHRCHVALPCPLLKPGHYSISTNTGFANMTTIQHLEDILIFEVELLSKPSAFLSYAEKRPGMIAVPLVWQISPISKDILDDST